jgi:hypothetical protein
MQLSKRKGCSIVRLLGALIAFCATLNYSTLLGMFNTAIATINDSSSHLAITVNRIHQPFVPKNYVGDAPVAQTDVWCHGCRFQKIISNDSKPLTCGHLLPQYFNRTQNKIDIRRVTAAYPECSPCADCSKGLYYRYDTVAPKVKQGHTFYLNSLPAINRFPVDYINNVTKFLSEESDNTAEMLWEFNPSIVILPASVRRRLGNDEFVYLASFRLSSATFCWNDRPAQEALYRAKDEFISYIGLALLRKDLSVIEEGYYSWLRKQSDFYLFVMENNDEILLTAGNYNVPLYLLPRKESLTGSMMKLRNYASTAGMPQVAIHARHRSCTNKAGKLVGDFSDKNLNYFVDADNNRLVEIWPMEPHVVDVMGDTINPEYYLEASLNASDSVISGNLLEPKPTFGTLEEPFFTKWGKFDPPWGRDRGSACCIKLSGPSTGSLLVGISHVRLYRHPLVFPPTFNTSSFIRGDLSFLSRFYAFQPTAPYNIVAKSGVFCLGWPTQAERGSSPFQHLGETFKLIEHFDDCPAISYVSGMTLKADDPSTAIIAYGINDCTARMVEIDVSEIKRLLFGRIDA